MLYLVLIALVFVWLLDLIIDSFELDGGGMSRTGFYRMVVFRAAIFAFAGFEIVKHWA